MCKNCNANCCKIVPPMIFKFEKSLFENNTFFDKYEDQNVLLLKKYKNNCIFLKNDMCQIYDKRPFNCKMFPFDIKKIDDKLYWGLVDFCNTPVDIEKKLVELEKILYKLSQEEIELYINYTKSIDDFKNNNFKILREVKMNHPNIEILEFKGHKFMFIDDYLWMWDTPQERELEEKLAKNAFGDVLVAGYGLGIVAKYLTRNPNVKSITTVEKHKEIIEKMKEYDKIYGKVIIIDFYDLPENEKFDCVIGDIWPDIDTKFLKEYVRFKKKSQKLLKNNGKILAWGKDFFEYLLKGNH